MNSKDREIKVLYLGPKSRGGVYTPDLDEQSSAAKEMGAEFVVYEGSSDGELIEALKDADVAMNQGHGIDPTLFTQMGNNGRCKGLVSFGHGYDGMDLNSAVQNGVILANTASFGTEEVSNQTMMHFLICSRKFVLHDKLVKNGTWTREYLSPMGHIAGQTFGIIGLGDIGRAVARKALAFGMNVIGYDPFVSSWDAKEYGVEMVGSPQEIAKRSDYVSPHTYLTPTTHHMINSDFFELMKPTAYLINCSRGPVVDEKALIKALQEGMIAGAGLDVFEQEPIEPGNPLLTMDNVSVTNHYASYSEVAWSRANTQLGEEAMRIALGYWPMSLINPDVRNTVEPRKSAVSWEVMVTERDQ
ncbi:MAG: C-terminal binding protein [SAR202 cluster bacterium]|nr:C-terminal binding protein [SAR202 cluster bacterium]|tara:strand:- start:4601 stop:5674 length:1074 start_codon:yes stop_codon:yes gene_type:complete